MDYGILSGVLKNKNGEIVKGNGKILDCTISDCSEMKNAETLAETIKSLNIAA